MELKVLLIYPENKLFLDGLNATNPKKEEQQLHAIELIDGIFILLQDLLTDLEYWAWYEEFLLELPLTTINSDQIKQA